MKILALRGENLASIQQSFEIDFAGGRLGESGLFAITGKTGAGKSTLLDAICLALYDRMPRLTANKKNDAEIGLGDEAARLKANDVRNILSRGKAEGYSEVDFVANNGSHWRAHWHVRRARGKADGRVQASEQWLENLEDGQRFAGKKQEVLGKIEELVGLSYEQFRRAVMLPQGEFAAFLKAGADERAALLERMTGGEIYSRLSVAAYEKAKAEKASLGQLEEQLGGISLLSDEEKQALSEQIDSLNAQTGELDSLVNQLAAHQKTLVEQAERERQLGEAQQALVKADEAWNEAQSRVETLSLISKVQPAQSDFNQLQQSRLQKDKLEKSLVVYESQLAEETRNVTDSQSASETAAAQLKKTQQRWEELEPNVRKAAGIDQQISHLSRQRDEQGTAQATIGEQYTKAKHTHSELSSEQAQLRYQQQQIDAALVQFGDMSQVAEQYQPVLDNLEQYLAARNAITRIEGEYRQLSQQNQQAALQRQELDSRLSVAAGDKAQAEEQVARLNPSELEKTLDEVQKRYNEDHKRYNLLSSLVSESADWLQFHEELRRLHDERNKLEHALMDAGEKKALLQPELVQLVTRYEEAEHALQRGMAVAGLSELRAQLRDGEACPLCGSAHHPYREEHPVVEGMLHELQQRRNQLAQQHRETEAQLHYIERQSREWEQQLALYQNETAKREQVLGQLESQLLPAVQQVNPDADRAFVEGSGYREWLMARRDEAQQLYPVLERSYRQLEWQQQQVNQLRQLQQHVADIERFEARVKEQLHQIENRLTQAAERQKSLDEQRQDQVKTLESRGHTLDSQFGDHSWAGMLEQVGAEQYVYQLRQQLNQYRALKQQRDEAQTRLTDMAPQISAIESELTSLGRQYEQTSQQLGVLDSQLASLRETRFALIEEPDLSELENRMRESITQSAATLADAEKRLSQSMASRATVQAQLESARQQREESQKQYRETLHRWMGWQEEFGLTEYDLMQLLSRDQSWQQQERDALSVLEQAVLTERTRITERQNRIEEAMPSVDEANVWLAGQSLLADDNEATLALQEECRSEWQSTKQELGEQLFSARQALEKGREAEKQAGELQEKLLKQRQQTELWMKMADVMGSATGSKFRNLAQALTLQQLVLVANKHLMELAPRYSLQTVPTSPLALQVVDHDMGDEVRSVESLSGGESFLLSLSLALALASLAADTRQLGSLFIDEGFGTLDPDSLEMALACLDTLQADGRQIGVISHVGTLVERIGVQVAVEAQGGGVSRVQVKG